LVRDINREITRFMLYFDKLRQYMHFGSELSQETRRAIALGERIVAFFDQAPDMIIPLNVSTIILAALWAGFWKEVDLTIMKNQINSLLAYYLKDQNYQKKIEKMIAASNSLSALSALLKDQEKVILEAAGAPERG